MFGKERHKPRDDTETRGCPQTGTLVTKRRRRDSVSGELGRVTCRGDPRSSDNGRHGQSTAPELDRLTENGQGRSREPRHTVTGDRTGTCPPVTSRPWTSPGVIGVFGHEGYRPPRRHKKLSLNSNNDDESTPRNFYRNSLTTRRRRLPFLFTVGGLDGSGPTRVTGCAGLVNLHYTKVQEQEC